MSDRDQELREALDALATDLRSGRAHPDPDALAAYHAGELPPREESAIQDHLAACRDCAALLLDLEGLGDPEFGAGSGLAQKEEVWRRLRDDVPLREAGGAVSPTVVPFRRRTLATAPRWLQTLAAALLLATLGQAVWLASLRHRLDEATQPRPAQVVPISSRAVRGEGSGPIARSVRSTETLILVIPIPLSSRSSRYRVVIAGSRGEELWRVAGLSPGPGGTLLPVVVPARALAPGEHRIRVLGEGGELIADQPLHVESP
jgi:hypothetical protein